MSRVVIVYACGEPSKGDILPTHLLSKSLARSAWAKAKETHREWLLQ